jgi:MFS family permease
MGDAENRGSGNFRLGWSAVLLISAAQFSGYADRALTAAFAPDLQAAFGLNDAQLGMLHGTAVILPYAAGLLLATIWLKRVRPFRLMAFSVIGWSLAAAGFALADSYAELLVARAALGLAEAAFAPAALSLLSISDHPPPSVAISTLTTGSSTGRSGGLLLGGALLLLASGAAATTGIEPWRLATLMILLPNILIAFALLRRSSMPVPLKPASAHGLGRTWRTMVGSPVFFLS